MEQQGRPSEGSKGTPRPTPPADITERRQSRWHTEDDEVSQ